METADNSGKVDAPVRVSKRRKLKNWLGNNFLIPMWLYLVICIFMVELGRVLEHYQWSFWSLFK